MKNHLFPAAIMKWPAAIPAGSICREVVLAMDLLPTLAHISGAALPARQLDGKNVTDLLMAKHGVVTPHEYFFYGRNAVRCGEWKFHEKEIFKVKDSAQPSCGATLYNLSLDIGETRNLIAEYPEIAGRLQRALIGHALSISKESGSGAY